MDYPDEMETSDVEKKENLVFKVERDVFTNQEEFEKKFHHVEPPVQPDGICGHLKARMKCNRCSAASMKKLVKSIFPILVWLPKYSWRKHLIGDIIAGCTVAIMHIPQGMGYALLGGVSPIVGIYMAFYPVLIYVLLGTSHHISLGTFAVTTLMTGKIVDQHAHHDVVNATLSSMNETTGNIGDGPPGFTNLQVATAVCLMVGFWQIIMCIFRLGVLGIVLSHHLVSGFTTAAAIHVVVSQIRNLLGIQVPRFSGPFRLIRAIIAICSQLPTVNPAEAVVSTITISILAIHNDWLKPWYGKKIKFPLPTELAVLVLGTVISYLCHLNLDYGIKVLDHIPTGFPVPEAPPYKLLPKIMIDCIIVAIVSYAVSLSMAKIFAQKRKYEISSNQELLAQGAANVFGSFFSCMPASASLSRSMLQETVGGETQLASVVSCFLLLAVLLYIGPFFESLPLAVLASVIVVALKGMFLQVRDFVSALKTSPLDAFIWMCTFLSVVIIDVDLGLILGVMSSISVLIYRGHRPYAAILGRLPDTEIFVDVTDFHDAFEEPGIKIFRWVGAVHFANALTFRHALDNLVGWSPPTPSSNAPTEGEAEAKLANENAELRTKYGAVDPQDSHPLNCHYAEPIPTRHLIMDCSGLSYIDLTGTLALSSLNEDLSKANITLRLAGCTQPVLEQLGKCRFFEKFPRSQVFPSIIDAVFSIQLSVLHSVEPSESADLP